VLKLVIKYSLPVFILFQIAIAQDISILNEGNTQVRANNTPIYNVPRLTLSNPDNSRTAIESGSQLLNPDPYLKFNMMYSNKDNLKDDYYKENSNDVNKIYTIKPVNVKNLHGKASKPKFNIVSSFRENIHFGGFYDRYAIINFTPAMSLKPFDFININASQIYSCFVSISGIKEHFKTLCIQGAAVLAVDNSVKLFFGADKMIPSIVGFAAKNIIITLLKSKLMKKSPNQIYSYDSYSYSFSIKF